MSNNASIQLEVGQIWTYSTRKGEENSRLTIFKIESNPNKIAHISLDNLSIKDFKSGEAIATYISHLPISLEKLLTSVASLEATIEVLENEGYLTWKEQFDQKKAGVWDLSVSEIVNLIEQSANQ